MAQLKVLSKKEISENLADLTEWKIVKGKMTAQYVLRDFRSAIAFINMVAIQAEVMNHHPEWTNSYDQVTFHLVTHHVGNEITDLDITLARYISSVSKNFI